MLSHKRILFGWDLGQQNEKCLNVPIALLSVAQDVSPSILKAVCFKNRIPIVLSLHVPSSLWSWKGKAEDAPWVPLISKCGNSWGIVAAGEGANFGHDGRHLVHPSHRATQSHLSVTLLFLSLSYDSLQDIIV